MAFVEQVKHFEEALHKHDIPGGIIGSGWSPRRSTPPLRRPG